MPNLDVVAVITAKPGSEVIVEEVLKALVGLSRRDHGCISYELFPPTQRPAHLSSSSDGSRRKTSTHT